MADIRLSNSATSSGAYDNITTEVTSSAVTVLLIDGLDITLAADKLAWVNGLLTFTITVSNSAAEPYLTPVITDILDPTILSFVDNSVMIDAVASSSYAYDPITGTLTVNLPTIAVGDEKVITFQVAKV